MNRIILSLVSLFFTALIAAQDLRVEPPFWWSGMENSSLQLLVKGDNITDMKVLIDQDKAKLISVDKAYSPNYLFLNLDISDSEPCDFAINFYDSANRLRHSYNYKLLKRGKGSADRDGFDNSDVMYLIMPDRFANGNPGNDEVQGMKEGLNRSDNYGRHGGDIQGIKDKLGYIKDMGFTAIWLNPLLENDMERQSYHGYATTDFYKVDRRYGTNEDYLELSKQASELGIKMIMDMIFNHCGSEHWWMEDPPFKDWINYYPDFVSTNHRRTVNMDPYASAIDKKGMVDGWFVRAMPDLNQRNPWMAEYLIQNSIWWIEYVGLAGIRMDTYPYPDKEMMAEWNARVLKEYPHFNIVGEEWSLNPVIVSYWQAGQNNRDGYDGLIPSMMDFPLQSAVSEGLKEEESFTTGLIRIYDMLANDLLYPDPSNLVIFPDNHDMARFFMQLDMDVDLYRNGITFFLTTRGVPQIFYGSEILMTHTGGNDHGNIRKDFPGGWESDKIDGFTGAGLMEDQAEVQNFFWTLLNWRKDREVIHSGQLMHYAPVDGVYVYFRYNNNDKVMVILNKNKDKYVLDLGRFTEMLKGVKEGKEIISGKELVLDKELALKPLTPMVIDLR
ncbi:MAG: glycoside hydrolase family 13 protein [Marinilabiliaceae bacterium]|jgi:glycosidase|nr:glycoside hydrolase family 13 protein [Marinilabiliaceae bacterium]